jgi:hypothetical protein
MKIFTRTVIDWDAAKKRYIVIAETSRLYFGPVAVVKGASAGQNELASQQADFFKTLTTQQNEAFANQADLLKSVRSVYDPIIAAGPNQYGFGKAEDTALRTQASEGTAANYRQASGAAAERTAAAGGGNSFLPSGVNADVNARIAGAAAGQESSQQLGITGAGYAQGNKNFNDATSAELNVSGQYNPIGSAQSATGAGSSAFGSATEIQKANAAASPWGAIGGMIGGMGAAFLGNPAAMGGLLGNAGGGNSGPSSAPQPGLNDPNFGGFGDY